MAFASMMGASISCSYLTMVADSAGNGCEWDTTQWSSYCQGNQACIAAAQDPSRTKWANLCCSSCGTFSSAGHRHEMMCCDRRVDDRVEPL